MYIEIGIGSSVAWGRGQGQGMKGRMDLSNKLIGLGKKLTDIACGPDKSSLRFI